MGLEWEAIDAALGTFSPHTDTPERVEPPQDLGRLYSYGKERFARDYEPQPHAEMLGFLDEAVGDFRFSGDEQQLYMLLEPRGAYKTTGVQDLIKLTLDKNPNARILISGPRHDAAKKRLRAVRREIEVAYPDWRPEFREQPWSDDEITITPRTNNGLIDPSVGTAGPERTMVGAHYDLIICDDLVTDRNSRIAEQRDKIYDHIADLMPILEPGGTMIVVGTRWHTDDAYGRLIAIDDDRVRRGEAPVWKKLIRSAINEDGTLHFPARLTFDFLARAKERMGSRKFSAQYLNLPVADEDKLFDMDRMREMRFDFHALGHQGGIVNAPRWREHIPVDNTLAWDPAGRRQTNDSDFHGITVVGCDPHDRWWIHEAVEIKATPSVVIAKVCRLLAFYAVHTVSIEDVNQSGLWGDLLKAALDERGMSVQIVYFSTGGVPKHVRIQALQPRWERGAIILKPEHIALKRQFDLFAPASPLAHEDILDSLVQHIDVARPAADEVRHVDTNPIDPEYTAREKRRKREVREAALAGPFFRPL